MGKLYTERETAMALGCSVYKLQRDRRIGTSIPFKKIGRSVRYDIADIEAYLNKRTFTSTASYSKK
jgi:hypothetical protein